MAKRDDDEKPRPQTWTPGRTPKFTDPDEIRFVLEQMASGEAMVSDALRFKALEMLATLTGLGAKEEAPTEIEDCPNTGDMTDAQLADWLRRKYSGR